MDDSLIWYDGCEVKNWTPSVIEDIVEDMGYEVAGMMKIHYCIPILSLARNGLREIRSVADTDFMLTFVSMGHMYMHVYLDHNESVRNMNWDDVVQFPVSELPPVSVSPLKPSNQAELEEPFEIEHKEGTAHVPLFVVPPLPRRASTRVQARVEAEQAGEEDESTHDSEDDDSDYNESVILDSDNDITTDDEDLHDDQENVDSKVDLKGKKQLNQSCHLLHFLEHCSSSVASSHSNPLYFQHCSDSAASSPSNPLYCQHFLDHHVDPHHHW